MHTSDCGDTRFWHNGDFSGDVTLFSISDANKHSSFAEVSNVTVPITELMTIVTEIGQTTNKFTEDGDSKEAMYTLKMVEVKDKNMVVVVPYKDVVEFVASYARWQLHERVSELDNSRAIELYKSGLLI